MSVIDVLVEGRRTQALVDTGAAVSVISAYFCRTLRKVMTPLGGFSLRTASAHHIQALAACTARVTIQGLLYIIELIVLPSCSHDVILGWDFLAQHNAVIDCARAEVEFTPPCDAYSDNTTTAKLVVSEDTTIPPQCSVSVLLGCASHTDATVIFTPSVLFSRRRRLPLPSALLSTHAGASRMLVTNLYSHPLSLLQGETLGWIEPVDANAVVDVPDDPPHLDMLELNQMSVEDVSHSDVFSKAIDNDLAPTQRAELRALL